MEIKPPGQSAFIFAGASVFAFCMLFLGSLATGALPGVSSGEQLAALSSSQIQSVLGLLSAYNVDPATIESVSKDLGGGSAAAVTAATAPAAAPTVISGPLKRSDVPFSPRSVSNFTPDSNWNNTLQNYNAFFANRIVWTYGGGHALNRAEPLNIPVQCTVPFWVPETNPNKEKMVCTNSSGGYGGYQNDLKFNPPLRRPDVNSEAWRAYQLSALKNLVDAGCTSFQQDTAMLNEHLVSQGGCYQPESKTKYTAFLAGRTSTAQLWYDFQKKSTQEYHAWLHSEVRTYAAGKDIADIPFSANTEGNDSSWLAPYFDFFFAEAYASPVAASNDVWVQHLRDMEHAFRAGGKVSGVTIPYSDVFRNQRGIASAYALGLTSIAPWDVYIPSAPRFFGKPADYASLYKMVRNNKAVFDDYDSWKDYYGTYLSAIPSQGYVESTQLEASTKSTLALWSRRSSFPITAGQKVWINNVQYTMPITSPYGVLRVPQGSPVAAGDPVYISSGKEKYLVTIRNNAIDSQKKAVHVVSWRTPDVVLYLHLKKSDFPVPPGKLLTPGKAPVSITPITLGNYYIYSLGAPSWAVLY